MIPSANPPSPRPGEPGCGAAAPNWEERCREAEQKLADWMRERERLIHVKRILLAIRNVNQTIVQETDPAVLIARSCQLLIQEEIFSSAWIGLLDRDGQHLASFASAGLGPEGEAWIRSWREAGWPPSVARALADDPIVTVPAEQAQAEGWTAVAPDRVLVLQRLAWTECCRGVLGVVMPAGYAAEEEDQALLDELSHDLAFALQQMANARAQREKEHHYRQLFETMTQGVVRQAADGRIVSANAAAMRILGLTETEILARDSYDRRWESVREDGSPLPGPEHPAIVALRTGREQTRVVMGVRHGQQADLRWLSVSSVPLFAAGDSAPREVFTVFEDITERRQAEIALRDSQERLCSIFRVAPTGIGVVRDRVIVEVNDLICEMVGYRREELLGQSARMLYPDEETYAEVGRVKYAQIRARGTGAVETRWRHRDGHLLWVWLASTPLDSTDLSKGVTFTALDITARKEALVDRERLLRAIEQSGEIIVITDPAANIQYVNPAFERVTGYGPAEVLGKNPRLLQSGAHDAAFYQAMWQTLCSGQTWFGRLTNRRKDGTRFTEEACISPVHDATGRLVNYVAVKRDITELLRINEERLHLEAQFHQAQKLESIGRLAGGVAHDLNNFLTPILAYGQMMLDDLTAEDPRKGWVDQIVQASVRARDVVRQLLAFSRKQVLCLQPTDLNTVLEHFLKLLRHTIREDVLIRLDLTPHLPQIQGDAGQLEQVVLNLLVNAQDAMPNGGSVTLTTDWVEIDEAAAVTYPSLTPGGYVRLSVRDTGCGMPEEIRAHLFEPFYTTKGPDKGTGLGLATCFGIIRQHRGHIEVYSRIGEGTTFRIFLPVSTPGATPQPTHPPEPASRPAGGTILLVEDNDQVRHLTRTILVRQGFQVLTASAGPEALRLAEEHAGPLHLLLTDVVMPEMSGHELWQKLSARYPDLKVLYMSGYAEDVIAHRGIQEAGAPFIQKPFSVQTFAAKVRAVLNPPA